MRNKILIFLLLLALSACNNATGPLTFDEAPLPGQQLYIKLIESDRIFIEHPPVIVAGGDERFVYTDSFLVNLANKNIHEVFVFHGIDTGDQVEMDTNLYVDGVPIYLRSGHGPKDDDDAWESKIINRSGNTLLIEVLCRVTGVNLNLNRLAARPHWGIWLAFNAEEANHIRRLVIK